MVDVTAIPLDAKVRHLYVPLTDEEMAFMDRVKRLGGYNKSAFVRRAIVEHIARQQEREFKPEA